MSYIVIETFESKNYWIITEKGGWVEFTSDLETKFFDTKEQAQKEADNCQDGIVVNLDEL